MLNVRPFVFTFVIVALGSVHGFVLPNTRIVNGVDSNIEDFPFLVSMRVRTTPTTTWFSAACGGTIIRAHVVLSAAHCYRTGDPSNFHESEAWRWTAVAGSSFLNTGGTSRPAAVIQLHPSYNETTLEFDVALVFLSNSFAMSSSIGLATVPPANTAIPTGTRVQIAGWGALEFDGLTSNHLQSAEVYIIDHQECTTNYSRHNLNILPSMFCAGTSHLGDPIRDACQGDSGGPLMYGNVVLGVVSWGYGCAVQYLPGVYASVPLVSRWIENSTAGTSAGFSFIGSKLMVVLVSVVTMALGASVCS